MRALSSLLPLLFIASAACGSSSSPADIGPDHDGGSPLPDGALPDGGGTNPGDSTDGSRIKTMYLEADDGLRTPSGWRDTELNVECSFEQAADGRLRCVPLTNVITYPDYGYYSDATCKTALGPMPKAACAAGAPRFASRAPESPACSNGKQIFNVGAAFSGTVYRKPYSTASCAVADATSMQTYAFYTLGTEVPPSSLVAAVRK